MEVITGDGERRRYRVADAAYWRAARARLEAVVDGGAVPTYPERVGRCDVCSWAEACDLRRRADDHLSLGVGMRRSAITRPGSRRGHHGGRPRRATPWRTGAGDGSGQCRPDEGAGPPASPGASRWPGSLRDSWCPVLDSRRPAPTPSWPTG
jgi:hypothetical protein